MRRETKIYNVIMIVIVGLITLVRFLGIQGYIAAITRDFSYLNNLNLDGNEKAQIINNFMPPISGVLNLLLLILGLAIILGIIQNLRKKNAHYFIPYFLIICYGVIDLISTLFIGNTELSNLWGAFLFVFSGTVPILTHIYKKSSFIQE